MRPPPKLRNQRSREPLQHPQSLGFVRQRGTLATAAVLLCLKAAVAEGTREDAVSWLGLLYDREALETCKLKVRRYEEHLARANKRIEEYVAKAAEQPGDDAKRQRHEILDKLSKYSQMVADKEARWPLSRLYLLILIEAVLKGAPRGHFYKEAFTKYLDVFVGPQEEAELLTIIGASEEAPVPVKMEAFFSEAPDTEEYHELLRRTLAASMAG